MSFKYTVKHEDLAEMVACLESISYTPEGEVIHECRVGPAVTQQIRNLLDKMKGQTNADSTLQK